MGLSPRKPPILGYFPGKSRILGDFHENDLKWWILGVQGGKYKFRGERCGITSNPALYSTPYGPGREGDHFSLQNTRIL